MGEPESRDISAQVSLLGLSERIKSLGTFDFNALDQWKLLSGTETKELEGLKKQVFERLDQPPYPEALRIINEYDKRLIDIFDESSEDFPYRSF